MNFNIIRLLLAAAVIVSHSPELIDGNRSRELLSMLGSPLSLGAVAVRCFFVLSGFLIVGSWLARPELGLFLCKRVLRIYPAFIVCSVLCLAITPLVGGQVDWLRGVGRMLALYAPVESGAFPGTNYPVLNGAMWTIVFEFMCYLMVAGLGACGLFDTKSRTLFTLVWAMLVCVVANALLSLPGIPRDGAYYYAQKFFPFAWFFLLGGFLYFLRDRLTWIRLPDLRTDISYGLYLYGWPVQKLLLWYWPSLGPWQLSLLALPIAGLLGYASWRLVEEPFMKLKRTTIKAEFARQYAHFR